MYSTSVRKSFSACVAGEMAQHFRNLAVLPEDLSSFPSIDTRRLTTAYNRSSMVSDAFFWLWREITGLGEEWVVGGWVGVPLHAWHTLSHIQKETQLEQRWQCESGP